MPDENPFFDRDLSESSQREIRYKILKAEIDKGLEDVAAGRTREWDFEMFLRRAGAQSSS